MQEKSSGAVWLVMLILAWSVPGRAEEEELEMELFFAPSEMVTSAARHAQKIEESPSPITVITREDIDATGGLAIVDLLRMVPGMDVIITNPAYSAISTRLAWNNMNNQFLVLIDGRDVNFELLGVPFWETQPLLLEDVERIEIIRGPGSALYGANALAGVINVTTRPIPEERTTTWLQLTGNELGLMGVGARQTVKLGDWGVSVVGGYGMSGSFEDPRVLFAHGWKFRTVAERRWGDEHRFTIDGGLTGGEGIIPTQLGDLDGSMGLRTVRMAYQSKDIKGHLYWNQLPAYVGLNTLIEFNGATLAEIVPLDLDMHTIDGEVQWTLPTLFEPLMLIIGGGARASYIGSEQLLDADTFSDINHPRYREEGIEHWEYRTSAFVHGEYTPAEWVTISGSLRMDYNTETEMFLSPRLAAVFMPVRDHTLRAGVARAFRKPAFLETGLHPMVEFPQESPIQGDAAQNSFQDFMTRVIGYGGLENEELISYEAGYLGRFLNGRLSLALDLYYNRYFNEIATRENMVLDRATGLPDLEESSYRFANSDGVVEIVGSELAVRFQLSREISLMAAWTHREVLGRANNASPKNLVTLGGRFLFDWGLLGSLYLFSRSEFIDKIVSNPEGLFADAREQHMPNVFLLLAKLGWRWPVQDRYTLEIGFKLFLPASPFEDPFFAYREKGGGVTPFGQRYGGDELRRIFSGYLQGSF